MVALTATASPRPHTSIAPKLAKTAFTLAVTASTRLALRSNSRGTENAEIQNTMKASTAPITPVSA